MGEIFERTTPDSALAWTGERLTTDVSGQVEIEHLHRYFFARTLCRDMDVLDIASGEGYGAALLAQVARSVIGIDVSAEAVSHAQAAYAGSRLRFIQGDARRIALKDASVDVVVSFETIEHFFEHEAFIAEVRRVLRPGGIFIVSSPERDIYSPADRPPNPYHVRELTHSEFGGLLAASFRHVTMYAQRPLLGSAIVTEAPRADAKPMVTFERRGDQHFECSIGLPRAVYLLAIASDQEHQNNRDSLYIAVGEIEALLAQIRQAGQVRQDAERWRLQLMRSQDAFEVLNREQAKTIAEYTQKEAVQQVILGRKDEEIRKLTAKTSEYEQQLGHTIDQTETIADYVRKESVHQAVLKRKDQEIRQLALRVASSEQQLENVLRSTSWRITGPLRILLARHPTVADKLRDLVARNPALRQLVSRALRRLRRMAMPRAQPASSTQGGAGPNGSEPTAPRIATTADTNMATPPKLWLYLGDTIDWLRVHAQLTGVGKVTAELFFASLSDASSSRMIPCALAQNDSGLGSISLRESVTFLGSRVGAYAESELLEAIDPAATPPTTAFAPSPGAHVLFTGVVWTPTYEALFQTLTGRGIRFSVLVYDIIPIENPEFVTEQHSHMFAQWLGTTLSLAGVVFVTSQWNKDQILRWAALSSVFVAAEVSIIGFGSSENRQSLSAKQLAASEVTACVRLDSYVLCVGTIDRRKNQALLCRVWQRLIADLGREKVPQLVFVGRKDLDLSGLSPGAEALFQASDIIVLEGLGDAELSGLYRHCVLTAFPSLAEGYGLPVAESLEFGKVCVSSDLPVIREHAGDLPWYFSPGDEDEAYALLRRAISDPDARIRTEARIARDYRPKSWKSTYLSMASVLAPFAGRPLPHRPGRETRPVIAGIATRPIPAVLMAAREWCTDLNPEVSILVINWNASQLTRECIRQIWANTTGIRYEIIIVDNGSDPSDLEALRALGSGVRLLALGTNRYFGEANNIAAEHAKGRYICLLNNDAFVQPGSVRALFDCLEQDPDAGAAGPLFLFPDGSIQEAGAAIDEEGFPVRFGRGESVDAQEFLLPKSVDYISAATLLMPRDVFLAAGGFDLTYEPAYYEDVDLCFKIRSLGRKIRFCPEARVIHVEGSASNHSPVAEARRNTLADLNRAKFVSRWGCYLKSRTDSDLQMIAEQSFPTATGSLRGETAGKRKTAVLFTQFPLTPGGGERFLLTTAAALIRYYDVTVVTPHPYSLLRLQSIGHAFGIDLFGCHLQTTAEFREAPDPDLMVVMGNHLMPPTSARSDTSIYICQFPFPLGEAEGRNSRPTIGGYQTFVVYSEYVRAHVLSGLSANRLPPQPIEVVYPPAPQHSGTADRKKNIILSVGRFFAGGHNKRHDLLITAFKSLRERVDCDLELHLAGSSLPDPVHMDYLNSLKQMADGLPVSFHVNAPQETLSELYRDAAVYWHATGIGADLTRHPELAEHFGISIVEAMSAECVPIAFGAGGPREIITHGTDGFLYYSIAELVDTSTGLFRAEATAWRASIGRAAAHRAAEFSPQLFTQRMRDVLGVRHVLEAVDGN